MRLEEYIKKNHPMIWNDYLEWEKLDLTITPLQSVGKVLDETLPKYYNPKVKKRGYTKSVN